MKLQISPTKRILDSADYITVWNRHGDNDVVIDFVRNGLQFKPGTAKVIYAFGVFSQFNNSERAKVIAQEYFDILEPGGQLYIIEPDFEYFCRAIIGGDMKITEFNDYFTANSYWAKDNIAKLLLNSGFPDKDQRVWFNNLCFNKEHYEIVISALKPKL
jgi:hypothetical protein